MWRAIGTLRRDLCSNRAEGTNARRERICHMLDYDQLEAALEASPAPRVTKEQIEARITGTEFTRLPDSGAKP